MSKTPKQASHFPSFGRLWKPAVATGAGGAAVAVWWDEIVMLGEEVLALIFLPIMAGALYLLDIFIFKSRLPRREDFQSTNNHKSRN